MRKKKQKKREDDRRRKIKYRKRTRRGERGKR